MTLIIDSGVLDDEAQDVVNLIVLDRASAEVDLVGHLIEAEFSFERLKEATLDLLVFVSVVKVGSVGRVLLLLQSRLPDLSNLFYFVGKFALQLERILGERDVLLVAGHQDWNLLRDDLDVPKNIVKNLCGLPKLRLFLGIE